MVLAIWICKYEFMEDVMKKLVLVAIVTVLGIMFLLPSSGYCRNPWRHDDRRPQYVVVPDHGPRFHQPAPVRYNYRPTNVYHVERRDDDRNDHAAVAVLGGIVVGALLGTVLTQGR